MSYDLILDHRVSLYLVNLRLALRNSFTSHTDLVVIIAIGISTNNVDIFNLDISFVDYTDTLKTWYKKACPIAKATSDTFRIIDIQEESVVVKVMRVVLFWSLTLTCARRFGECEGKYPQQQDDRVAMLYEGGCDCTGPPLWNMSRRSIELFLRRTV